MRNKPNFSELSEQSLNSLKTRAETPPKLEVVQKAEPEPAKPTEPTNKPNRKKTGRRPLGDRKKQQFSVILSPKVLEELKPILEEYDITIGNCLSDYIETHIKSIKKFYKKAK